MNDQTPPPQQTSGGDPAAEFTLLVPATRTQHLFIWTDGETKAVAEDKAEAAAGLLRATGVKLAEVSVGNLDPILAVSNEFAAHPDYYTIISSHSAAHLTIR